LVGPIAFGSVARQNIRAGRVWRTKGAPQKSQKKKQAGVSSRAHSQWPNFLSLVTITTSATGWHPRLLTHSLFVGGGAFQIQTAVCPKSPIQVEEVTSIFMGTRLGHKWTIHY
jgi:hypothetical protein